LFSTPAGPLLRLQPTCDDLGNFLCFVILRLVIVNLPWFRGFFFVFVLLFLGAMATGRPPSELSQYCPSSGMAGHDRHHVLEWRIQGSALAESFSKTTPVQSSLVL
jgi:hypothetical protein